MKHVFNDGRDDDGYARFESELSVDGQTFTLKIDSTKAMTWEEALLALACWLNDEAKALSDKN